MFSNSGRKPVSLDLLLHLSKKVAMNFPPMLMRKSITRRMDVRDDVLPVVLVLFVLEDGRHQAEADKLERFDVVHEEGFDAKSGRVDHNRVHKVELFEHGNEKFTEVRRFS